MDDLWRNKGPDCVVDEHDIVGSRRNCRDCIGNGMLSMLSAFDEVYFPRQDIALVLFQSVLKPADLVLPQSNVNLRNLQAGGELTQCMNKDWRSSKLGKLLGRNRLLSFRFRSRRHARP